MSLDFEVYGTQAVDQRQVHDLVAGIRELNIEADAADVVTVSRGKRGRHSFTIEGPMRVEPEDIPFDLAPGMGAAGMLWRIMVEGDAESEAVYARRFVKSLAKAARGVGVDLQTDEVFGGIGQYVVATPPSHSRVRVLELSWYSPADPQVDVVRLWAETCHRHLPQALPRRFGDDEPLPHHVDRDGVDALAAMASTEDHLVSFTTSGPCLGGSFGSQDGLTHQSLSVLDPALGTASLRTALRRFFLDFAQRSGAVLATGEIVRDAIWRNGSLCFDEASESWQGVTVSGRILGLPAYPLWWVWARGDRAEELLLHVPAATVTRHTDAVFVQASPTPMDRDGLRPTDSVPATVRVSEQQVQAARDEENDAEREMQTERERVILQDLHEIGVFVDDLWDLVEVPRHDLSTLRVLLRHLRCAGGYAPSTYDTLGRAIAVREASGLWSELAQGYREASDDDQRVGFALALEAAATSAVAGDYVQLLSDPSLGDSRACLMYAARRVLGKDWRAELERLRDDPDLGSQVQA